MATLTYLGMNAHVHAFNQGQRHYACTFIYKLLKLMFHSHGTSVKQSSLSAFVCTSTREGTSEIAQSPGNSSHRAHKIDIKNEFPTIDVVILILLAWLHAQFGQVGSVDDQV